MNTQYDSRTADKFVVRLPDGLRNEVQGAADHLDTSMNTVFVQAVRQYLDNQKRQQLLLDALAKAVTGKEELDAVLYWRSKHAQVIRERDALQQRLTAADERADVLETVSVKQAALLDELGIPLDEVDDLFGETLENAKRYEYLRSVMAVENFPTPHPEWSEPSEAESKRIDYLCDAALKPAEGGGDEYRKSCEAAHKALSMENQRIVAPGQLKCLACGDIHSGSGNLPCPKMSPTC